MGEFGNVHMVVSLAGRCEASSFTVLPPLSPAVKMKL